MKRIIRHLRTSSTVYRLRFVRDGGDEFQPLSNTVFRDPTSSLIPTGGVDLGITLLPEMVLRHAASQFL
jgi:hypothetical protein